MRMIKKFLSLFKINDQYFSDSNYNRYWNLVLKSAFWFNLIYVFAIVVIASQLYNILTLSVPLMSYANLLLFLLVPLSTIIINLNLFRKSIHANFSILGIILNLVCFIYLFIKPEYANLFVEFLILAGPSLNILTHIKIFWDSRSEGAIKTTGV